MDKIERPPPVLVLVLERFRQDGSKNKSAMGVPRQIDISPYVRGAVKHGAYLDYHLCTMVLNSVLPAEQAKGGDCSTAEKEVMTQEMDGKNGTEERTNNDVGHQPPKDLELLKNGSIKGLTYGRFKNLVENGWLTREDFDKMTNVREVVIPKRGKVIQFLQHEKERKPVNIKSLGIFDVRSVQEGKVWGHSKLGRLSSLVKQNVSQRGTEYTCNMCKETLGGRSLLVDHLYGAHSLWMEQTGYSGNQLSTGSCKKKISHAVMAICDPELQIERVILKGEWCYPTDIQLFRVHINPAPLKRKEAQNQSKKEKPSKKKRQQMKEEMAELDRRLEQQKHKLRKLEEREVDLRSGGTSQGPLWPSPPAWQGPPVQGPPVWHGPENWQGNPVWQGPSDWQGHDYWQGSQDWQAHENWRGAPDWQGHETWQGSQDWQGPPVRPSFRCIHKLWPS